MSKLIFRLSISREEYLKWYSGSAKTVTAKTEEGVTVNFPANILQPYITHDGVNGTFCISFDDNNRFQNIEQY